MTAPLTSLRVADLIGDYIVDRCDDLGHPVATAQVVAWTQAEFGLSRAQAAQRVGYAARVKLMLRPWGRGWLWPRLFPPAPPKPSDTPMVVRRHTYLPRVAA